MGELKLPEGFFRWWNVQTKNATPESLAGKFIKLTLIRREDREKAEGILKTLAEWNFPICDYARILYVSMRFRDKTPSIENVKNIRVSKKFLKRISEKTGDLFPEEKNEPEPEDFESALKQMNSLLEKGRKDKKESVKEVLASFPLHLPKTYKPKMEKALLSLSYHFTPDQLRQLGSFLHSRVFHGLDIPREGIHAQMTLVEDEDARRNLDWILDHAAFVSKAHQAFKRHEALSYHEKTMPVIRGVLEDQGRGLMDSHPHAFEFFSENPLSAWFFLRQTKTGLLKLRDNLHYHGGGEIKPWVKSLRNKIFPPRRLEWLFNKYEPAVPYIEAKRGEKFRLR